MSIFEEYGAFKCQVLYPLKNNFKKLCHLQNFARRFNPLKTGDPYMSNWQTVQNAASDQGLHCLQIVQPFLFSNIYII